jgi:fido (protein-threonine AMPylation protein)
MPKTLPEIVFASADATESKKISRWVKSGLLRKMIPRVYTSNFEHSDEAIVHRNLYPILGGLYPGAVLSHRTALEGGPTESNEIFLTCRYKRTVKLPGITVRLLKGPGPLDDDMPFLGNLFMASRHRAFLENLQVSRASSSISKVLPRAALGERLERICQAQGEEALNQLRDRARLTAQELGLTTEFEKLNKIVGAILGTRSVGALESPEARARSRGVPYDALRLDLFNALFAELGKADLPIQQRGPLSDDQLQLLAFFEAYFSNYIEGTEFEIDEARQIVFENRIPERRPQDAHDIMGTYRIAVSRDEMRRLPNTPDDFLTILKARHRMIMEARPEKLPGEFKSEPNRAGSTHFVAPEMVEGTLRKGLEMSQAVVAGLPRAIFIMFVVAEVHPFVDGNGRVARAMMNAELVSQEQCRILIPVVYRDDYLLALRAQSRRSDPTPLIKTLVRAQEFCAALPLDSYEHLHTVLSLCNAFKEPDEGRLIIPPTTI